jgi:hypothetical protein
MGFVFSGRSAYEEADVPATQLGFIRCTLPSGAGACSDSNIQTIESAWVTSDHKNLETRYMLSNLVAWHQTTPRMDVVGVGAALPTIECHINYVNHSRNHCLPGCAYLSNRQALRLTGQG